MYRVQLPSCAQLLHQADRVDSEPPNGGGTGTRAHAHTAQRGRHGISRVRRDGWSGSGRDGHCALLSEAGRTCEKRREKRKEVNGDVLTVGVGGFGFKSLHGAERARAREGGRGGASEARGTSDEHKTREDVGVFGCEVRMWRSLSPYGE